MYEELSAWSVVAARQHSCNYALDGVYEATVEVTNAAVRIYNIHEDDIRFINCMVVSI